MSPQKRVIVAGMNKKLTVSRKVNSTTALKRLGDSSALKRILECIGYEKLLRWMPVNRCFYLNFVPGILKGMCILTHTAFWINKKESSIEIFHPNLRVWKAKFLSEIGDEKKSKINFFETDCPFDHN